MKKQRAVGAGMALVGSGIVALVCLHLWLLDGLGGAVLARALQEDTVYAEGYSDAAFRRVTKGMTQVEVEEMLGPPHSRWAIERSGDGPDAGASWSHSPGDTHHRCRAIVFRDGHVLEKHAEFYVD
jgi:hypothetical protein